MKSEAFYSLFLYFIVLIVSNLPLPLKFIIELTLLIRFANRKRVICLVCTRIRIVAYRNYFVLDRRICNIVYFLIELIIFNFII